MDLELIKFVELFREFLELNDLVDDFETFLQSKKQINLQNEAKSKFDDLSNSLISSEVYTKQI